MSGKYMFSLLVKKNTLNVPDAPVTLKIYKLSHLQSLNLEWRNYESEDTWKSSDSYGMDKVYEPIELDMRIIDPEQLLSNVLLYDQVSMNGMSRLK